MKKIKCKKCADIIRYDKHKIEKVNGKPAVQCDNCGCFIFLSDNKAKKRQGGEA